MPSTTRPPPASSPQRKRGSTESIDVYAVQCCECLKWRTFERKDEFETIRENFTADPWCCSKRHNCSCEDPADIEYDSSRVWVMDRPDIPKPPPKTERLLLMRSDFSKLDAYYVMPNGKRARCIGDVTKFLEENPEYKDSLPVERFSFAVPRIVEETVSESPSTPIIVEESVSHSSSSKPKKEKPKKRNRADA